MALEFLTQDQTVLLSDDDQQRAFTLIQVLVNRSRDDIGSASSTAQEAMVATLSSLLGSGVLNSGTCSPPSP